MQFAASLVIGLVLLSVGALATPRPDLPAFQSIAVTVIAALPMLWIVRHQWPERWSLARAVDGFGMTRPASPRFYAIGAAAGVAIARLGDALTAVLAQGHPVSQFVDPLGRHASMVARVGLAVPAITLVPVVEEVLFRGVLLCAWLAWRPSGNPDANGAPSRGRTVWAVAASAALFGLAHLPELAWQWYALPTMMLSGAVLAVLRIRSGSLWPGILTHAVINAIAALALLGVIAPPS